MAMAMAMTLAMTVAVTVGSWVQIEQRAAGSGRMPPHHAEAELVPVVQPLHARATQVTGYKRQRKGQARSVKGSDGEPRSRKVLVVAMVRLPAGRGRIAGSRLRPQSVTHNRHSAS